MGYFPSLTINKTKLVLNEKKPAKKVALIKNEDTTVLSLGCEWISQLLTPFWISLIKYHRFSKICPLVDGVNKSNQSNSEYAET